MSKDADMVRSQVEAQLETLVERLGQGDDWVDVLNEEALSVEYVWKGDPGNIYLDQIEVVLCTGGPHVEIQYGGRRATIVGFGWFGADRYSEHVANSDVLAMLESLFELAEGQQSDEWWA